MCIKYFSKLTLLKEHLGNYVFISNVRVRLLGQIKKTGQCPTEPLTVRF